MKKNIFTAIAMILSLIATNSAFASNGCKAEKEALEKSYDRQERRISRTTRYQHEVAAYLVEWGTFLNHNTDKQISPGMGNNLIGSSNVIKKDAVAIEDDSRDIFKEIKQSVENLISCESNSTFILN